jgi:hypothetical protein
LARPPEGQTLCSIVYLPTLSQPADGAHSGPLFSRRGRDHWQRIGVFCLALGAINAVFERAFAVDDTYLLCKGSISVISTSVTTPVKDQEIALHIMSNRVNISGNNYFNTVEMQICRQTADDFYFDSQSCSGRADLSRPRNYGTFNKITGKMDLSSENYLPNSLLLLTRGQFICKKTEPVMK